MKIIKMLIVTIALFFAFVLGQNSTHISTVNAQASSPAYTCNVGNSGQTSAFPCAQYLIEVAPQRMGGGTFIYQLQNEIDISNPQFGAVMVANGTVNSTTSIQAFQPNSSVNTVTITSTVP